ncbi:MAG: hypothetical protein E5X33_20155 [Mesorhizobium sp.]|uniref:hypothetical protein n=1 Tax=Mesorhizobium sp. TaxID=1871066 RepID=UPI00121F23B9|nr:hypothetical protein [Mesorhizobium sp.]TIR19443.1 MAG: hypothetical protein E5X33_20155 [Mesorhizobium sp.]
MKIMRELLIASGVLFAANPALADQCADVLSHGIWESHSTGKNVLNSSEFANWACSNSSSATGVSIGYAGFDLGYTNDEAQAGCSTNNGRYMLSDSFISSHKVAAREVVEAWSACMNAQGAHISFQYDGDPKHFSLLIKFYTPATNVTKVRLTSPQSSAFDHCSLTAAEIRKGLKVTAEKYLSCERPDPTQGIQVDADFGANGGAHIALPGIVISTPPPDRKQWEGAYGVALAATGPFGIGFPGCNGAKGLASILRDAGDLYGQNECGRKRKIAFTDKGELLMDGIAGRYDGRLNAIFWGNGTQWIKTDPALPIVGSWKNPGPHCGSGPNSTPTIGYDGQGRLFAMNECSQKVNMVLRPDGSVRTDPRWRNIVGTLVNPNTLQWSNGSIWVR